MSEGRYRAQDESVITGRSLEELIKNLVFKGFIGVFCWFVGFCGFFFLFYKSSSEASYSSSCVVY